jgi:hypothetical protein
MIRERTLLSIRREWMEVASKWENAGEVERAELTIRLDNLSDEYSERVRNLFKTENHVHVGIRRKE